MSRLTEKEMMSPTLDNPNYPSITDKRRIQTEEIR